MAKSHGGTAFVAVKYCYKSPEQVLYLVISLQNN